MHVKGFTSSGLTMVAHAFDFMANINIHCWRSWKVVYITLNTHTLLLFIFLGCQKTTLITSKSLLKFYLNQTPTNIVVTPHLSCPWCHEDGISFATKQSIAPTTHVIFWFDSMQNKMDKIQINKVKYKVLRVYV
jgi:hypothetical protein